MITSPVCDFVDGGIKCDEVMSTHCIYCKRDVCRKHVYEHAYVTKCFDCRRELCKSIHGKDNRCIPCHRRFYMKRANMISSSMNLSKFEDELMSYNKHPIVKAGTHAHLNLDNRPNNFNPLGPQLTSRSSIWSNLPREMQKSRYANNHSRMNRRNLRASHGDSYSDDSADGDDGDNDCRDNSCRYNTKQHHNVNHVHGDHNMYSDYSDDSDHSDNSTYAYSSSNSGEDGDNNTIRHNINYKSDWLTRSGLAASGLATSSLATSTYSMHGAA